MAKARAFFVPYLQALASIFEVPSLSNRQQHELTIYRGRSLGSRLHRLPASRLPDIHDESEAQLDEDLAAVIERRMGSSTRRAEGGAEGARARFLGLNACPW